MQNAWYPHLLFARSQRMVQGFVRNYTATCCCDYGFYERIWFDK